MTKANLKIAVVITAVTVFAFGAYAGADTGIIAVKAGRVDIGDGTSIANGVVLIENGRITAVGADLSIPEGARIIERADGVITPGLIDANVIIASTKWDVHAPVHRVAERGYGHEHTHWQFPFVGLPVKNGCCGSTCPLVHNHATGKKCKYCGFPDAPPLGAALGVSSSHTVSEESSEVVPFTNVIDSIDLQGRDFSRLAAEGVTTVFISPDSASVIGARGAMVKTAGSLEKRVIKREAAIKASMGGDPSYRGDSNNMPYRRNVDFHARRPHTRMGVTWVFRKALHEARAVANGLAVIGGADTPPEAAWVPLIALLKGEIPLRIQARTQIDILAALRLADEFGLDFTLEEGLEAYRCVEELKAQNVPVIYGPIFADPVGWRSRSGEADKTKLATAKRLTDYGIEMALTANDMRGEEGLAAQAMYAMRFGLSYQQALASVTSVPAHILGIDAETGTVATGKSADLIVWSGQPLSAVSRPEVVLINGEVITNY